MTVVAGATTGLLLLLLLLPLLLLGASQHEGGWRRPAMQRRISGDVGRKGGSPWSETDVCQEAGVRHLQLEQGVRDVAGRVGARGEDAEVFWRRG